MGRKPKPKQPAAPQGAYGEWRQHVAALLERKGLSPGVRLERAWRNAFISGETSEQAADRAEVEARNARTSFERQRRAGLAVSLGLARQVSHPRYGLKCDSAACRRESLA